MRERQQCALVGVAQLLWYDAVFRRDCCSMFRVGAIRSAACVFVMLQYTTAVVASVPGIVLGSVVGLQWRGLSQHQLRIVGVCIAGVAGWYGGLSAAVSAIRYHSNHSRRVSHQVQQPPCQPSGTTQMGSCRRQQPHRQRDTAACLCGSW